MSTQDVPHLLAAWHSYVREPTAGALDAMLAPDVVFRSPAVHTPQEGKEKAFSYLWAALEVLGPSLSYHREWISENSAVLEFTSTVNKRDISGVDIVSWNADHLITDFTVMVRPLRGLEALIEAMGQALSRGT